MVHQVASHEEFVKLLATPDKVVFVDFHAKWCRPCKVIGPVFEKISSQYPDCLFLKVGNYLNQSVLTQVAILSFNKWFAIFTYGIRYLLG